MLTKVYLLALYDKSDVASLTAEQITERLLGIPDPDGEQAGTEAPE